MSDLDDRYRNKCRYDFAFNRTLQCMYYINCLDTKALPKFKVNYDRAIELLKTGDLIHQINPVKEILRIHISICDNQKQLVEYIINNLAADTIEIFIGTDIDLNLSQMQPIYNLDICDLYGYFPKEYLYHLVKLLENGRAKIITFQYKKNISLKEDLDEFENINVRINPLVIYSNTTAYEMRLKK